MVGSPLALPTAAPCEEIKMTCVLSAILKAAERFEGKSPAELVRIMHAHQEEIEIEQAVGAVSREFAVYLAGAAYQLALASK